MEVTSMTIEGAEGPVVITRTKDGARVSAAGRVVCEMARDLHPDERFAAALQSASAVYGTDRRGRARATNSMVHEVLDAIERVAGC